MKLTLEIDAPEENIRYAITASKSMLQFAAPDSVIRQLAEKLTEAYEKHENFHPADIAADRCKQR